MENLYLKHGLVSRTYSEKSPHHGIDLWLQVQIFYDRIDHTLKRTVDYAAGGRLRKMSAEKAWATIEELARYKDEGWNDPTVSEKGGLNYENPNLEQLLRIMECKEAFEDLVMNFILDQEEKVKQLEEYMGVIGSDFMQLSSEVVGKLKEEIRMEENRTKKIKKITREVPIFNEPESQPQPLPGLLGHSGSLGVDFLNFEMIEDDWQLEPKEVSFLKEGLNLPVWPKELEKGRMKETHQLEHKIQQILFQHMAASHHNGVYRYYHPHLNSSVGKPSPLSVK
ncbi:hypothetical protein Tco_1024451 [Tanacetum coccineum]